MKSQLDQRISNLIHNVYGKNTNLFLKREAVRFMKKIKIQSFDLIFTEHQDVGAKTLFELMTKLYMDNPNQPMDEYLAVAPESDGKQLTQTTQSKIKSSTVTLLYEKTPVDKPQFQHIKDFYTGSVSKFGYTYAFKCLYDKDLEDTYYQLDLSLLTSMFFTYNKNAVELEYAEDSWLLSSEALDNLRSYLSELCNSLSKAEKEFYGNPIKYIPRGNYKIGYYLDQQKITLTQIKKAVSGLATNDPMAILENQRYTDFIEEWEKTKKEKYPDGYTKK